MEGKIQNGVELWKTIFLYKIVGHILRCGLLKVLTWRNAKQDFSPLIGLQGGGEGLDLNPLFINFLQNNLIGTGRWI